MLIYRRLSYKMNKIVKVMLLKGAREFDPDVDPYVKALCDASFDANLINAIVCKFINLDQLQAALSSPGDYSCLVLSSPRSAQAVRRAFDLPPLSTEWRDNIGPKWASKHTFVVGEATSTAASDIGLRPLGVKSGNAANLALLVADEMIKCEMTSRPVLMPCSQLSLETLPKILTERGLSVECLTVYDTIADENLYASVNTYVKQKGVPECIVFFSPSIVNCSHQALFNCGCLSDSVKLIAIGPTTETAMRQSLGRVDGTASRPNPESVRNVIQQLASSAVSSSS